MTGTEAQRVSATAFGGVTPILRVQSLSISIDYYVTVLGFKLDWHEPGIMASVSRDRCSLMLCEGDQGNPGSWVWIGVGDVEPPSLSIGRKGRRCGIRRPTIRGLARCRLKIQTDMCCASARSRRAINPSVSGVTCMATVGCFRLMAAGRGSRTD